MNINYYAVQNEKLKPYIDYFYTLKNAEPSFSTSYLAFPHLNTPLCFLKDIDVQFTDHTATYRPSGTKKITAISWGMFVHPVEINIHCPVDKVCIVFKPLGLNHFIRNTFNEAVYKNGQQFTKWKGSQYDTLLLGIFATDDDEQRCLLLEHFLIGQFAEIKQEAFLRKAVLYLTDIERNYTVEDICEKLNVTPRTLRRTFKDFLGTSPVEFKKIARFRHSLNNNTVSVGSNKTLSRLSLDSNFYDQSYFVKVYQQMTGKNPSRFFNAIEKKANNNFILQILSERLSE